MRTLRRRPGCPSVQRFRQHVERQVPSAVVHCMLVEKCGAVDAKKRVAGTHHLWASGTVVHTTRVTVESPALATAEQLTESTAHRDTIQHAPEFELVRSRARYCQFFKLEAEELARDDNDDDDAASSSNSASDDHEDPKLAGPARMPGACPCTRHRGLPPALLRCSPYATPVERNCYDHA